MKRTFLILAVVALGGVMVWFYLTPEPLEKVAESEEPLPAPNEGPLAATGNPIAAQKGSLDGDEVERAFGCVDQDGVIACGRYKGGEVMYYAALTGSQEQLDKFGREPIVRSQANTAMNVAAALGDLATVRHIYALAEEYGALEAARIDEHAAIQAAAFGSVDVLDFFVEKGLNVNQKFSDGYTDLFVEALIGKNPSVVDYLLAHGYRMDCDFKFPNGKTYHDVASQLELPEVSRLIERECAKRQ